MYNYFNTKNIGIPSAYFPLESLGSSEQYFVLFVSLSIVYEQQD